MYATSLEQDITLFFKLYLLRRQANYVDYMADARTLFLWFNAAQHRSCDISNTAFIICGHCFNKVGNIPGGSIAIQCSKCHGETTISYEIAKLSEITGMSWDYVIYFLCKAIEDIYRSNNTIAFQNILRK